MDNHVTLFWLCFMNSKDTVFRLAWLDCKRSMSVHLKSAFFCFCSPFTYYWFIEQYVHTLYVGVCLCIILSTSCMCGDLGINNKTPNRMLTRQLTHTKCINTSPRIRLHASIRLKSEKRKIIKSKVANGKRSRQNEKDVGVANLEPVERDKYSGFLWTESCQEVSVEPTISFCCLVFWTPRYILWRSVG